MRDDRGADGPAGLAALEAALGRDFQLLNHPPAEWVPERQGPDGPLADVLIAGAGMNGLSAAFALRRLGLRRIVQLDRAPPGREGPWLTYARMELLRSPKQLTGPAQGLPNLTFRAWWEAQGRDWGGFTYALREDWAAYLGWYARVTGARIESRTEVTALEPGPGFVRATLRQGEAERRVHARQVVLATGRVGRPRVPAPLAPFRGPLVRHSSEAIDFAGLAGRRVAVIGLAASAFDNAAAAAEAGAAVVLVGRAPAIPRLNKMRQTVYPGFAHGFAALPDAERLAWLRHVERSRIAPPRATVERVAATGRVTVLTGAEVTAAEPAGPGLRLLTTAGPVEADLVILGTGFAFDPEPPELRGLDFLRWRNLIDDPGAEHGELLDAPALGPGFELRGAGEVGRIRLFSHAAQPSLGALASDIPHASEGAGRLARAIARSLFVEDAAEHRRRLESYAEPEILGDEWPGVL